MPSTGTQKTTKTTRTVKRQPIIANRRKRKSKIDIGTLIPALIAIILLVAIIILLGKDQQNSAENLTQDEMPQIERVQKPERKNFETPIELGEPETQKVQEAPEQISSNSEAQNTSSARIFFVKVSDEGKITLKSLQRTVPASSSPLLVAINTLLEGPRPNELSSNLLSLVPEESILLGARIQNGTAYLDFNEMFRFNALGIEGYRAQIEQIVFTATEFPTVNQVQFLIEGQRVDYLGGEGFYVGSPLSRSDF